MKRLLFYAIIEQTKQDEGETMKLYAPKYYRNFKCIADKCSHSCCIGWEIDVDGDTLNKYESLKGEYGAVIRDTISLEGTPHFKLCEHDRCPHLDENGLCRIILSVGEDHLCRICREHPRFYNYTDVAEVGIGMSCREAARIILNSDDYSVFEQVGELDVESDGVDFDARDTREEIYTVLRDRERCYADRLKDVYGQYSIEAGDDRYFLDKIASLEYLDVEHKALFLHYSSKKRAEGKYEYLERFLAYFIYRHCSEALDYDDFCDRLSFCLFCERLLSSLICSNGAESLSDIAVLASIISEEIEYSEENTLSLIY